MDTTGLDREQEEVIGERVQMMLTQVLVPWWMTPWYIRLARNIS